MHDTAYEHGRLFFELYWPDGGRRVVDLGSQDVNGSLRDHCPASARYIGLDLQAAKGVDVVVGPGQALPIASDSIDAVVTTSAFEHDVCFWETFLELARIVRPGGLIYINAPSNYAFHRYSLDCWRFYPDAGAALVRWAERRGVSMALVESFVAYPRDEKWADFVAVFRKPGGGELVRRGRIADRTRAINIHDVGTRAEGPLEAETPWMPEMQGALELEQALAEREAELGSVRAAGEAEVRQARDDAARQDAARSGEVSAAQAEAAELAEQLGRERGIAARRVAELEAAVAASSAQLGAARSTIEAMCASTSWRMTAGLRWLVTAGRGR